MGRIKTQSDEEILAIAREVFLREGHGASTRAIAKAASISEAILYQRFETKAGLFFRAMIPADADLGALVRVEADEPRQYLQLLGEKLVAHFVGLLPILLHVITHPGLDPERMHSWHQKLPFPQIVAALGERFAEMRRAGQIGEIDPLAAAQSFVASMLSTALFETLTDALPPAQRQARIAALIDVAWTGFQPHTKS